MNNYLLHFLDYNDAANVKLLAAILTLPDNTEAIRLFSHMISSQDKWYNRLTRQFPDEQFSWFGTVYPGETLAAEWRRSTAQWRNHIIAVREEQLDDHVIFTRPADGKQMRVKVKDVIFQLCTHAVHHRAQINKLISAQGVPVPATDYIFTALQEVE